MTNENKDPKSQTDSAGSNKAGDVDTTNQEYTKRESGIQNVPTEPVGNPVDDAESETAPPRPGADPDKGKDEE